MDHLQRHPAARSIRQPVGVCADRPRPHRAPPQGRSPARSQPPQGRVDRSAPPHRRFDAADHLVGGIRMAASIITTAAGTSCSATRSRPSAAQTGQWQPGAASGRPAALVRFVDGRGWFRPALRDGIPARITARRRLPLVSGARVAARSTTRRRHGAVVRHEHRHPRSQDGRVRARGEPRPVSGPRSTPPSTGTFRWISRPTSSNRIRTWPVCSGSHRALRRDRSRNSSRWCTKTIGRASSKPAAAAPSREPTSRKSSASSGRTADVRWLFDKGKTVSMATDGPRSAWRARAST